MPLFQRIDIEGFRRLASANVELRDFCVLIGANGVGKTTFLDAFWLLAQSAQGKLESSIRQLSGLSEITTLQGGGTVGPRDPKIHIGIDMAVDSHPPLQYKVAIGAQGTGHQIERETLTQQRPGFPQPFKHIESSGANIAYYDPDQSRLVRPTWDHNPFETSLSQVPRSFRASESLRQRLASSTFYHALSVEPGAPARLPQPMRPAALPGRNGEDIVSCLYSLREGDRDRFDAVCQTMAAAFPGFERLDFPPVAAGTLAMTLRDTRFSRPLYMHQLSEGTLRFLWLVTLLHSPGLTSVTLIDEPEVSLHPELLRLLAHLMREASKRTQLVVATHSDRLVRFLKPEEVLVMDCGEDGLTQLSWADALNLDEWPSEYSLDEIWQVGRLGGRA